jgi:hypothetical protein
MKTTSLFLLVASVLIVSSPELSFADPPKTAQDYLQKRIDPSSKRYNSYVRALGLMQKRKAKILVETGTARFGGYHFEGDGGSTIIFGEWAQQNQAFLYSVDLCSLCCQHAKEATQAYAEHIRIEEGDSVAFLQKFKKRIDFLYLDSMDFDLDNPLPSQEHHLKEIKAAYPKLHRQSIVMIDDCNLPHGGKGKLAIRFLIQKGWRIIFRGYQVIMIPG